MLQALYTADLAGRATTPAPQNRQERNRDPPTSSPRARRQHLKCSSTPPAISQTPRTVGDPSKHSDFSGWCKILMVDAFTSVLAGPFRPTFWIHGGADISRQMQSKFRPKQNADFHRVPSVNRCLSRFSQSVAMDHPKSATKSVIMPVV